MWRLVNYIYRAFRTVAIHRCPQDIIVPVSTVSTNDDEFNREKNKESLTQCRSNIHQIIKNNQFSLQNVENLQEYLHQISRERLILLPNVQIEVSPTPLPWIQQEETLDSLFQADEACKNILKSLSDLNNETMSMINNQLGIEALEADDVQLGIEALQRSVKDNQNVAALYNLGICYERGIGVEEDRAKACDYYRQAALLGHTNAQFNLSILSNRIDMTENEEQTTTNKSWRFRFSFPQEEQFPAWNNSHVNLSKTLACLS